MTPKYLPFILLTSCTVNNYTTPETTTPITEKPQEVITVPDEIPVVTDELLAKYPTKVFEDNFDIFDRTKWCTRYQWGGGPTPQVQDPECVGKNGGNLDFLNDEQQRYRDTNTKGQALHTIDNGALVLNATQTYPNDSWVKFESAMIRSKFTFKPTDKPYLLQTKVYLPSVKGSWPAWWVLVAEDGWPPEIDFFEAPVNAKDDRVEMLHFGAIPSNVAKAYTYTDSKFDKQWGNYFNQNNESLRDRWITISIEWTKTSVTYYIEADAIDSRAAISRTKIMSENYEWKYKNGTEAPNATIVFNLAMGGNWAGRYGLDGPATMKIDYIRVYQ